ncbi:MAG: hypothetical protein HGA73_04245, partial [Syntrophaceae bacterium]|nr:hypothetical protein [Syntrophaceae bacterium]
MKKIDSTSMIVAAVALLALAVPVYASSQMMDRSMKEHKERKGHMMEMVDIDKMGEMMGM